MYMYTVEIIYMYIYMNTIKQIYMYMCVCIQFGIRTALCTSSVRDGVRGGKWCKRGKNSVIWAKNGVRDGIRGVKWCEMDHNCVKVV